MIQQRQDIKLVIFDFDGTLVDSLQCFIEATNRLANRYNYPPVEISQIPQIRALSSRALIQQIPIARWQFPFFLQGLRREVQQLSPHLKLFDGVKGAVMELKKQDYRLGIVTSNTKATVDRVLVDQDIDTVFDFIHAGHGLLGKAKVLRRLVKQHNLLPMQAIYVGDETRDIEAAQQAQLSNIAVSWGFNNREILEQQQPDLIIDYPNQLVSAINHWVSSHSRSSSSIEQ